MSKTETQTPAEKLAREYRPTMPADVLHLWAVDVVAELRRLDAESKALREALEAVGKGWKEAESKSGEWMDRAEVNALRADAERWKAVRVGVPSGDRLLRVYTMKQGCGTWLQGFQADAAVDAAMAAAKTGDTA